MNFTIDFLKKLLKENDIEIHSISNKGISVVSKRFIRTLKNGIYEHMAAVSKKRVY